MFPRPPMDRCLPEDPASSNLRPHVRQVRPLYPDFQLPSYATLETPSQMPQDPARKLSLQMSPSPLVHSRTAMQSRLQNHPSSVSKLSLQMSPSSLFPPGTLMQSSLQWHSDPERSLGPQVSPGPSTKPSLPRHPGPPTLGTRSVHPSPQMPSSFSLSSGCEGSGSLGPMVPSDKYGDQQVCPEAPRKQRKERTVYSKEQKLLLQEHFDECMYPSMDQRMELAIMVGVTEHEIQIWFKNQRAKYKQKNPNNIRKELPESSRSYKDVSGSTHSCGHLRVLASANIESMSPGTSTVGSIAELNPSLEAFLQNDQAVEDASFSSEEDLLDDQAPAVPPNPGKRTVVEAQTDPAVTEGPASVEAPVSTTAAAGRLDDAQYLYPPSEQFWQWVGEDLDTGKDS